MIQKQREELKLKVGDKAYFASDFSSPIPHKVTITGECEEGYGYEAFDPEWTDEEHPDGRDIHTCNGTLYKTKKEARAGVVKVLTKKREQWVQEQAYATRWIHYIDWVLSRGGRW